jgi:hypothetical protein
MLCQITPTANERLALLKLDIPVVYGIGRRAVVAVEKGVPGERALAEAFQAWEQVKKE